MKFLFWALLHLTLIAKPYNIDFSAGLAPWLQETSIGKTEFNTRFRMRINSSLELARDCIALKNRLTTGRAFNNEWNNIGLGVQANDLKFGFRHLYIEGQCASKIDWMIGSIPVVNYGRLGLSANGNINGFGLKIKNILFSLGNVGSQVYFYDQKSYVFNHASVQYNYELEKDKNIYLSASSFSHLNFLRTGVSLKNINLELIGTMDHLLGGIFIYNYNFLNFNHHISISHIETPDEKSERLALRIKQFYGYGLNVLLESEKEFSKKWNLNSRIRFGEAEKLMMLSLTYHFSL